MKIIIILAMFVATACDAQTDTTRTGSIYIPDSLLSTLSSSKIIQKTSIIMTTTEVRNRELFVLWHNGDLYYNPRLLLRCDYCKDTLIYWGNIYK